MFGKVVIGKALAGLAVAGVFSGALATGVMAAPATTGKSHATAAQPQRAPRKDLFAGTVTAISDSQLTVKNHAWVSKTFVRDAATQVYRGKDHAAWSEIAVNSQVGLRFGERGGKLYAIRIQIGRAHVAGIVTGVDGNVIAIKTRDGKNVRVSVTAKTRFVLVEGKGPANRKAASLKDIHAGQHLYVTGNWDQAGSLDAALVLIVARSARSS